LIRAWWWIGGIGQLPDHHPRLLLRGQARCGAGHRGPGGFHGLTRPLVLLAVIPALMRPSGTRRPSGSRAGSGSGRCGASDSDVPRATREIQHPKNQEEGCPSVDAVREAHDARGGRDTAAGNTRDPGGAEVAVLPWSDQAVHAGSRGRCPPPVRTFGSGVVIGCVHRDVSCDLAAPVYRPSALGWHAPPGPRQGSSYPSC